MTEIAAKHANTAIRGTDGGAAVHDPGRPPLRRGRVGASRRRHRRPGEPGLRAARRRVPEDAGRRTRPTSSPRSTSAASLGSPERERSVKQMISRVAGTIAGWGREGGYFATDEDADAFEAELTHILLHQKAAFNSPVWFNVGFEERPQCSACFILRSRTRWSRSSTGTPRRASSSAAAPARGSTSPTSAARWSTSPRAGSPPARSASCAAPTPGPARSSPAARPAARRRWSCSTSTTPTSSTSSGARRDEEDKAAALRDAGFDMRLDSEAFSSIQYQNANNSVRVTDEFMQAVEADADWDLTARTDGAPDQDREGARADEPDRRRRLALRRPGRPVRHDDQPLAHLPRVRAGSTRPTRAPSTCTSTTRPATSPRST